MRNVPRGASCTVSATSFRAFQRVHLYLLGSGHVGIQATELYHHYTGSPPHANHQRLPAGMKAFLAINSSERRIRQHDPAVLQPKARLYWLLYTAPLEMVSLFGFALTSLRPGLDPAHDLLKHQRPSTNISLSSSLLTCSQYSIYNATLA